MVTKHSSSSNDQKWKPLNKFVPFKGTKSTYSIGVKYQPEYENTLLVNTAMIYVI